MTWIKQKPTEPGIYRARPWGPLQGEDEGTVVLGASGTWFIDEHLPGADYCEFWSEDGKIPTKQEEDQ